METLARNHCGTYSKRHDNAFDDALMPFLSLAIAEFMATNVKRSLRDIAAWNSDPTDKHENENLTFLLLAMVS